MEREKAVRVMACVAAGLPLSLLVGHPYSVTIPVTAILICSAGMTLPLRGSLVYGAKRVLVQLLSALFIALPVLLLGVVPAPVVPVSLLAGCLPIALLLFLDCRFRFSPNCVTTAAVSSLIMLTGSAQSDGYWKTRVLLVFLGFLLGVLINFLFGWRNSLRRVCKRAAALLRRLREGGPESPSGSASREISELILELDRLSAPLFRPKEYRRHFLMLVAGLGRATSIRK